MRVTRGRLVTTLGPWSNGHQEQCAIVTNVHGDGDAPGTPVNLHIFVDEGQALIQAMVPWYPTREAAVAALDTAQLTAGARACWFPEKV